MNHAVIGEALGLARGAGAAANLTALRRALGDRSEDRAHRDPRCMWLRRREVSRRGAILVRPDRIVAWRSPGAAADPLRELGAALAQVLDRSLQ